MEGDTQKALRADAMKNFLEYFGCRDLECDRCPVKERFVGLTPDVYYNTDICSEAMVLDMLRRQAELDAATFAKLVPTCRYEPESRKTFFDEDDNEICTDEPDPDCDCFVCSACGAEMRYQPEGWFDTERPWTPHFDFCPYCGFPVEKPAIAGDGSK